MEFLGSSPKQEELLASDSSLPPSLQALPIRTTVHGAMPHQDALKLLKEGNERFAVPLQRIVFNRYSSVQDAQKLC